MKRLAVAILAGLSGCATTMQTRDPMSDLPQSLRSIQTPKVLPFYDSPNKALHAGWPTDLIPVGTDTLHEYFIDPASLKEVTGTLQYTMYGRSKPLPQSPHHFYVFQSDVLAQCAARKRLEATILYKHSNGTINTTRNDPATGLRPIYERTRQAGELDIACASFAARSTGKSSELVNALSPTPEPNGHPTPSGDRSAGSSLVEGMATVALIALLLVGAAYAAKGGNLDRGDPIAFSGSKPVQAKLVSKRHGSITEVTQEAGSRVIYSYDTGTKYKVSGESITGSDGSSYKIRGTQVISSTGQTYERIGSTLLRSSDGRECQLLSSAINCN